MAARKTREHTSKVWEVLRAETRKKLVRRYPHLINFTPHKEAVPSV